MKTAKNLTVLLALALGSTAAIGCAADAPGSNGDDDGMPDPQPEPTPTTDATGIYAMRSTFDIAANMPGPVGVAVNTIIAATDGGDDPSAWLLEQAIAKLPSGGLKNLLTAAKPLVASYLNQRLAQLAPDLLATLTLIGHDTADIAHNVGLNETLNITKTGTDYTAVKTVLGAHFKIGPNELDLKFSDYSMENVVVPTLAITFDASTSAFGLGQHTIPLSYGKILRVGLDGAIIPQIDPTMHNLADLLQSKVDCTAVGAAISNALGLGGGGGSTFTTACRAGVVAGASAIYAKLDAINGSALEFALTGTAQATDTNGDKKIDKISTGVYTGTLGYAGTPAPLATATFYGDRM